MTLGKPLDQAGTNEVIGRCLDAGINFFDTANMYNAGVAETLLGNALKGRRDKVVLASKVFYKMGDAPDQQGLSRKAILRAIDESLQRLQTDYLDFYYLHAPDHTVPVEESLETMDSLVRQGKVRYLASSNYAGWEVVEMLWLAKDHGWHAPYVSQPMYNLLARGIEQEYLPMCRQFGISMVVYNPLAGGLLTGKHKQEVFTAGTRFDNNKLYQDRYWHTQDFHAVERLRAIACLAGRSLISLSLNWLQHHTAADVIILGASSLAQLNDDLVAAAEGPLPEEIVKACDQVWQDLRGPLPVYNR
jgi:aryl-alcohol dehydrogenase-like predicted oxidoreductase